RRGERGRGPAVHVRGVHVVRERGPAAGQAPRAGADPDGLSRHDGRGRCGRPLRRPDPGGVLVAADYYALLKIRRDATQDEVKRAYRRLARELHPDVNPDPETQERFKEITQAYEVLSDTDKRRMYDMGMDPFASSAGAAAGPFGQGFNPLNDLL